MGFDVARAFAIFGMVLVNFKIAMHASSSGPAWLVNAVHLFEGRAAATFVVLAGIGISLMSRKAREEDNQVLLAQNRTILFKRALFLFIVGLLYTPIWPADILHFYGLYIAIAALLLSVRSRWLLVIAVGATFLFVLLLFLFDYEQGWNWETLHYEGFWTMSGMVRHLFYNGFHPVFPWVAFILYGMVLGRFDWSNIKVQRNAFLFGLTSLILAEVTSWFLLKQIPLNAGAAEQELAALFGTAPMPPMPLYIAAGIGLATVVISLSVWLCATFPKAMWVKPLTATGQLALTLYVAHVLLGMGALQAMGRLEHQSLWFSVGSTLAFCAFAVLFATLWRNRFKRGPLEYLMRRLVAFRS